MGLSQENGWITQKGLAKELKISQPKISKLESGKQAIDIITLTNFSAYYNKPIFYFFPENAKSYFKIVNREE